MLAHGGESDLGDIEWFNHDGTLMTENDWRSGYARTLMVFLIGDAIPEPDALGRRITDDHFLMMFNAHDQPVDFVVPPEEYGVEWEVQRQTADLPDGHWKAGSSHSLEPHSLMVLSTSVIPVEKASAARSRAQKAAKTIAKQSARLAKPAPSS